MAVVYFVVLLTAVISLGTFVAKQNDIASTTFPGLPRCVLFASYEGHIDPDGLPQIKLGQDAICLFSIWGEAALACASLHGDVHICSCSSIYRNSGVSLGLDGLFV